MQGVVTLLAAAVLLSGCKPSGQPGAMDKAGYHVRDGVVWFLPGWTSQPFQIAGADVPTFQHPLSKDTTESFARDKNHVYFRGRPVPRADPASFAIIDSTYWRDATHVFRNDLLVCDDPDHFESLGVYVKNGHSVYHLGDLSLTPDARVVSTDVASFRDVAPANGNVFFADSRQLFVGRTVMEGVDPAEFKFLGSGHWKDSEQVYYRESPMPQGTDMATFEALEEGYARDGKRAYYLGKVLPGSDGATFVVTDPKWPRAKDAKRRYDQGRVLPLE